MPFARRQSIICPSVRFSLGDRISFGHYNYFFAIETILESRTSRFHNITVAQAGSLRMLRFDMLGVEGVIHLAEATSRSIRLHAPTVAVLPLESFARSRADHRPGRWRAASHNSLSFAQHEHRRR